MERSSVWDNARALLIFCVVLGHATDPLAKSGVVAAVNVLIYLFHMPLFVFIAGYFSKKMRHPGADFPKQRCAGFLLLIVAIKLAKVLIQNALSSRHFSFQFFNNSDATWYLMALIFWTALAFVLGHVRPRVKPWVVLIVLFVCGVITGMDAQIGDTLGLSRILLNAPYFFAGLYFKPEWLETVRKTKYRIAAAAGLLILTCAVFRYTPFFAALRPLLTGRAAFAAIPAISAGWGFLYRVGNYLLSTAMGLAVLLCVPARRIPLWTEIGRRTLQIFFYQSIFMPIATVFRGLSLLFILLPLPLYFLLFAALTVVWAWKPLGVPVRILAHPRLPVLFREKKV
jgi:fucose 4-O-acetylase-like acetyltransferase